MDKLQQANALQAQIHSVVKRRELVQKILELFLSVQALPKIGIQVNPKYPDNVLWIDLDALPINQDDMIDGIIKKLNQKEASLKIELENLLK